MKFIEEESISFIEDPKITGKSYRIHLLSIGITENGIKYAGIRKYELDQHEFFEFSMVLNKKPEEAELPEALKRAVKEAHSINKLNEFMRKLDFSDYEDKDPY
jgi:hypothetical protein